MKKQLFLLLLAAATIFTGCSSKDDGGDGGTTFTPPTDEQLSQNAYADKETTGEGFTFTTAVPWTATVNEVVPQADNAPAQAATRSDATVTGNNVSWLKLFVGNDEAYSGEAGTITIRIEVEQNYTGERREATITIVAGGNTFTVTVVQEGTKQDGSENEPPVQVTAITLSENIINLSAGETKTLSATVEPANATITSVTWSTSNPDVATVNPATGEVTAVADGTATVTATSNSNKAVSASCRVFVGEAIIDPDMGVITRIDRVVKYWDKIPADEQYDEDATFTFDYDELKRVTSYAIDIIPTDATGKTVRLTGTIDYSAADHLTVTEDWSDTGSDKFDVIINNNGFITECPSSPAAHDKNDGEYIPFKLEYDGEERISRLSYDDYWNTFVYKNGVLSGGTFHEEGETFEDSGLEAYFSDITNNDKMSIDLNCLMIPSIMAEEPEDGDVPGRLGRLAMFRLTGRPMDRLIGTFGGGSDDRVSVEFGGGWPNPNETKHFAYYEYQPVPESETTVNYRLNEDGTVQSIDIECPMAKILKEYDIISTDVPFMPEAPEAGYEYVETNHKETVEETGITTISYTITYR